MRENLSLKHIIIMLLGTILLMVSLGFALLKSDPAPRWVDFTQSALLSLGSNLLVVTFVFLILGESSSSQANVVKTAKEKESFPDDLKDVFRNEAIPSNFGDGVKDEEE